MTFPWKYPLFFVTAILVTLAMFGSKLGKTVPVYALFLFLVLFSILLAFVASKAWQTGVILSRGGPVAKADEPGMFYAMFVGVLVCILLMLAIAMILLMSLIR
jgi:hypothetical protein